MAGRVAGGQSWLFPYESPLDRALPPDFFRRLPACPGVYRMLDADGRTLYVGKAKSLRVRLRSYRRAEPGRAARKTLRLVERVRAIVVEPCADETAALLRENALLRATQPPFNVQKTRPQFYAFIGVRAVGDEIALRVTRDPEPRGDTIFGAFKGVWLLRVLCQALCRLAWLAHRGAAPMPARLAHEPGNRATLRSVLVTPSAVRRFFAGTSDGLHGTLVAALAARPLDPFESALAARDLELVAEFFTRVARRGLGLRRRHGLRRIVPQARIDDLLVLSAGDAPI